MPVFDIKLISAFACIGAIVVGTWGLADYSNRPGLQGTTPETWPSELFDADSSLAIGRAKGQRAVLLFYHPHCPCTKATVRCLERLSTRFSQKPDFVAIAFCPSSENESWIESPITDSLRKGQHTRIVVDWDGQLSRRFGVYTSGHTVVYDESGKLLFSGGFTPGRGHEGDGPAASELLERINGQTKTLTRWPVFGCAIIDPEVAP